MKNQLNPREVSKLARATGMGYFEAEKVAIEAMEKYTIIEVGDMVDYIADDEILVGKVMGFTSDSKYKVARMVNGAPVKIDRVSGSDIQK